MLQRIALLTILVHDYDDAITFYTKRLGFTLVEDTDLGGQKRWVRVAPPAGGGAELLLARATTPEQSSRVGNQAGERVFLFLETDDFDRDYDALRSKGVEFVRTPQSEPYGK